MSCHQILFLLELVFILCIHWTKASVGECFENNATSSGTLFLITFGSGPDKTSKKKPSDFGFSTELPQVFNFPTKVGSFGFYNEIAYGKNSWHHGALDHTENDTDGYMFLVDFNKTKTQLFNYSLNDLCIGSHYEFSAYLANVARITNNYSIPKVYFKVQTATPESNQLARLETGNIYAYENMTWMKYGLSFIASNTSIDLLIISASGGGAGNDLAIDDVALRVCQSGHSSNLLTGKYRRRLKHHSIFLFEESPKICHDHDVMVGKVLSLRTFGSGVDMYSKETPCRFDFSTNYEQLLIQATRPKTFAIVNRVPAASSRWHVNELDHTANDTNGYMYLIDLNEDGGEFFRSTFTELCLGIRYEVSLYITNAKKKFGKDVKPNVRLEIRTPTADNDLIAQLSTGEIPKSDAMSWSKYSLSFVASSSSVVFLMIASSTGTDGNDLAIDDIQLQVGSNTEANSCFPHATNNELLLSITFDAGASHYSNKTPSYFGFRSSYQQAFASTINDGTFDFINSIPNISDAWHSDALDHTPNDAGGYMYLVNAARSNSEFFRYMINGLCIGRRYEFSAYLANLNRKGYGNIVKPNISFEIRSATVANILLAQLITDHVSEYYNLTWLRYSLAFVATSEVVFLQMLSLGQSGAGNDFVVDDIEFRACHLTDCVSPVLTIIPNASSLAKRLQFRRSQDIYITSSLQLRSIIYQWTIVQCSPICSSQIDLPNTTHKDLLIQSQKLSPGLYELRLTAAAMTADNSSKTSSVSSVWIEIFNSYISASLVSLGRSSIKHHSESQLLLNPGNYSSDPIKIIFFPHKWSYQYYCRTYDSDKPMNNEEFRVINERNQTCFPNQSRVNFLFNESSLTKSPSISITAGALKSNQTYQFMVHMSHLDDSSVQAVGYLFVNVENTVSRTITISCLISTICSPIPNYNSINRNTQLTLLSACFENCPSPTNITWKISRGNELNQWTVFNSISSVENLHLSNLHSDRLTMMKEFFQANQEILYWRFEVTYLVESKTSSKAFDIKINDEPENGFCTIDPSNGTVDTLFTITCSNWTDENGIKDYTFYAWTKDPTKQIILNTTTQSICQLRLPANTESQSYFHLIGHIRDTFGSITEYNLASVLLFTNLSVLPTIIDDLEQSILETNNSANLEQLVSSLSNILHELHEEQMEVLIEKGFSPASISVSSLNGETSNNDTSDLLLTDAIPPEVEEKLNKQANTVENLMRHVTNLSISDFSELTSQSAMISELTQTTNQLTRKTSALASEKCQQLSKALEESSKNIRFEDIQSVSTHLLQCASNVMTGINGPLQGRTKILNVKSNQIPTETNSPCNNYADEKQINLCYQKEAANAVRNTISQMISSITASLSVNLEVDQSVLINRSSVYFSLEKFSVSSLANRTSSQVRLPLLSNFSHSVVLLRSMIEPLSFADNIEGQSTMKYSRSVSFSILDEHGNGIPLHTTDENPIEILIPRDPSLRMKKMRVQNVTNKSMLFNYHLYELRENYSIHLELHSLNESLVYLLIYQFDIASKSTKMNRIDGWKFLCEKNQDQIYTFYLNNNQTLNHQTVTFGIREGNMKEEQQFCTNRTLDLPRIDQMRTFSASYAIRSYASSCFYLDEKNKWQSDGLLVGPETDRYQTQCLTTHLTTSPSDI